MNNSKQYHHNLRQHLRFYAVTDRAWVDKQTLPQQIEAALAGGVTMLQLREKKLSNSEFVQEALKTQLLCQQYSVPLIINDNIEVALETNADGLHIGQDDCPVAVARAALGADKILGVSTQTVEQAITAEEAGADYLGVGAIFATSTKNDADSVTIPTLTQICKAVNIPVVAIGGINVENVPQLQNIGICGVALVSAIFANEDITTACRKLNKILNFK